MKEKITIGAILAIGYMVGFIALTAMLAFGPSIPAANEKYLLIALGSFTGFAAAGVQFFLGSSLGSQKKDETIQSLSASQEEKK